jgi:biotin carboxyl carrier protein
MSQMIGTQSVSNVLNGKYTIINSQLQNYIKGMYGKPPSAISNNLVKTVAIKDILNQDVRPADLLEPELPGAKETVKHITSDIDDVLTYALYPTTGMKFLRQKHGLDPIKKVENPKKPYPATQIVTEIDKNTKLPHKSSNLKAFNVFVENQFFKVEVDPVYDKPDTIQADTSEQNRENSNEKPDGEVLLSPMPGTISQYKTQLGDQVKKGDVILILEAMKMENALSAPKSGIITEISFKEGDMVTKGDILAVIS